MVLIIGTKNDQNIIIGHNIMIGILELKTTAS